jgi:adenylate cyclase
MQQEQAKPALKLISNNQTPEFVALRAITPTRRSWRSWLPRQIPIAVKLSFIISLLIALGMTLLGSVIINNQTQLLQRQINAHGTSIAAQLAESVKEPILAEDMLTLRILTSKLTTDEKISGAAVLDSKGRILAQSGLIPLDKNARHIQLRTLQEKDAYSFDWQYAGQDGDNEGLISFIHPVLFQDIRTGYILFTFSRAPLEQALTDSVRAVTAATIMMIILAVIVSFLMSRRLSRPIHHLMNASKAIDEGKLSYRIQERRNDEIGELIQSFNTMADGLLKKDQVEQAFSRFVSSNVAEQIMGDLDNVQLGGKHVYGSVLFADIVGYTDISEHLAPTEIAAMLNEYFTYIGEATKLYNGTIDKFMGDCAMVVFGISENDDDHAFNAVACAVLIQRIVDCLSMRRVRNNQFPVQFRIGVNSGEMLAGNMGSNDRMEFTVVGDAVNLASRLCSFASPGHIVINKSVYAQNEISKRILVCEHESIRLRSRKEPVPTYLVSDVAPSYRTIMNRQLKKILGDKYVP